MKGRCPRPLDDGDAEIDLQITDLLFLRKMSRACEANGIIFSETFSVSLGQLNSLDSIQTSFNNTTLLYNSKWRPQGDSNPCYRRERAVS